MSEAASFLQIAYASRNLVPGEHMQQEIESILALSRMRNATWGVTGALLFSADSFVQVLEGPEDAVETLFEKIQLDPRHAEVVVLQASAVQDRGFAQWSMAYAGRHDDLRFADLCSARGDRASSAILRLLQGAIDRMPVS